MKFLKSLLVVVLAIAMVVPSITVFAATSIPYKKTGTVYTVGGKSYYQAQTTNEYNGVAKGTIFWLDTNSNVVTKEDTLKKLSQILIFSVNGYDDILKSGAESAKKATEHYYNAFVAIAAEEELGTIIGKASGTALSLCAGNTLSFSEVAIDVAGEALSAEKVKTAALIGILKVHANNADSNLKNLDKLTKQTIKDYDSLVAAYTAYAECYASLAAIEFLAGDEIAEYKNDTVWDRIGNYLFNVLDGLADSVIPDIEAVKIASDLATGALSAIPLTELALSTNSDSVYSSKKAEIYSSFMGVSESSIETAKKLASTSLSNPSNNTVGSMTSSSSKSTYTTDEKVVITWSKAANATRYGLTIVNNATNEKVVNASNFTGTSYTVGKLPAGTYRFNMCGYNSNGSAGPISDLKQFTVVNNKNSVTSGKYNATAAIEYGKNHWNDGKGLCAEFVSNCLKAGGSSAWHVGCTTLVKQLQEENWGTLHKLNVNSNGTISLDKNKNILSPGDPIFVYSTGCLNVDGKPYVHVYLYYDTDSNGNLKGYAHNNASNGTIDVYYTCYYCDKPTDAAYVFHMNGSNGIYPHDDEDASQQAYVIDVNGHINGSYKTSLNGYVTFDVYIDGTRVKNDVGDFNTAYVDGTTYEIKDIKPTSGYKYVSGESLSGKINGEKVWVYINIANDSDDEKEPDNSTEWSEWSTTKPESKDYRTIESKTQYGYYHYVHKWTDTGFTGAYPVKDYKIFTNDPTDVLNYHEYWSDSKLSDDGSPWKGGGKSYDCYPNKCCSLGSNVSTSGRYLYDLGKTRTVYRYKDEEPEIYTIKYNANGGSDAPSSQTKTHGESIKVSSQKPTRSGYEFDGWATSANGNVEYDPSENYTKDGDITLYAVWKPLTYKVTYNANGGTGTPASQTKIHNEKLYITGDTPERDGYSFVGWATTKTGSVSYKADQQYTSDRDITLYAVWEANTYTINYNANGGSSAPKNQTKKYAESIKLSTQEPTRDDYIFLGWSTSAQGSVEFAPGSVCSVNENITLYALWREEENEVYYIIYNANGGKNAPSMQTKNEDEDITISEVVPTREGYTFDGWAIGNDDTVIYSSGDTYKENKTLYLHAVWTANTYTISYDANGGFGAPRNQTKIHDEDIVLSIVEPEREGHMFIGWSDDRYAEYAKYYVEDTFTKNSDTVLYAVWEEIIEEDKEDEETNDDKNQSQDEIPFEDVPEDAWYRKDVENAYKNGLINGKSEKRYAPDDNMTYAEAIKLACTIYQLYYDGEVTLTNGSDVWYSTYMDYALENRIVRTDYSSVANEYVTRKEFVNIFYGALPLKEFARINNVDDNVIPDVKIGDAYSGEIYTFYRAGILTGNDAKGTFKPDSNISRSEVAAIVTRMLDSGARKYIDIN